MIVARFKTPNGGELGVFGLTKADMELLVRSEVLLLANVVMVVVCVDDDATLEASVRLASQMMAAEFPADEKPTVLS